MSDNNLTGFLNIYKEAGFTSFDVIAKLRGILHQKKIGHMGTLDPDASGVLPIALGKATKALMYLPDHTKEYRAELLLGVETDTYDTSGEILLEKKVDISKDDIIQAFDEYKGKIKQVPPMYSAKKINGRKLYELAREGIEVERKAEEIEIFKNEIRKIDIPKVEFEVECSKGTYIRSICHDIGERLGVGGCMASLVRTRSGGFDIKSAYKLDEVSGLYEEGKIDEILTPIDKMLDFYPKVTCKEQFTKKATNGATLLKEEIVSEGEETGIVRVYIEGKKFLGLYEWGGKKIYPRKVFG